MDDCRNSVNFLTGENVEDSDDDEPDETCDESYKKACQYLNSKTLEGKLPNPIANETLPSPLLSQKVPSTIQKQVDSVFTNHFQTAEAAKLSVLEKHVKTTTIEKQSGIGGKKICWNYRKGKCKKGHRCQFAHDNDIARDSTDVPAETVMNKFQFGHSAAFHASLEKELPDDDSYMASMKRKKRYGVRDGLVPPKKAHNELERQRAQQRPWTVKSSNPKK